MTRDLTFLLLAAALMAVSDVVLPGSANIHSLFTLSRGVEGFDEFYTLYVGKRRRRIIVAFALLTLGAFLIFLRVPGPVSPTMPLLIYLALVVFDMFKSRSEMRG